MKSVCRLAVTAASLAFSPLLKAQSATPVPHLDLNRLSGVWFEQAHLPDKAEKHCTRNATTLYALGDKPGRIQVVNTCLLKDGTSNVRNSSGRIADKSGDGKLKVPYYFFFSKKYWVLGLGPNYEWALVGTPNHKTLAVLTKSTTPPPALITDIESRAAAQGFNVSKLLPVPYVP